MSWHTTVQVDGGVYRISEPFGAVEPRVGLATINTYLVVGREQAALIDSGTGIGDVAAEVRRITELPCAVLNTHSHWDHIGANHRFADRAIHAEEVEWLAEAQDVADVREEMRAPAARAALPAGFDPAGFRVVPTRATRILQDGDEIDLGGRTLRALHTPGHSPGHVAFHEEASGILFTGDVAYRGPLFACFSGSRAEDLAESLRRIAGLPGVRLVCPGHEDLIATPGWLAELADFVDAAVRGRVERQLRRAYVVGRECRRGDFSLWLPE